MAARDENGRMRFLLTAPVVLAVLAIADRLLLRAEARGWIFYRRRRSTATPVAEAAFGPVFDLLQPARQVVNEERERQGLMRDQPGQDED